MAAQDKLKEYREKDLASLLSTVFDIDALGIPPNMSKRWRAAGVRRIGGLYEIVLRYREAKRYRQMSSLEPKGLGSKYLSVASKLCDDLGLDKRLRGHISSYKAVAAEAYEEGKRSAELSEKEFEEWREALRSALYRATNREIMEPPVRCAFVPNG